MLRSLIALLRFAALAVVTVKFVVAQALWGLPWELAGRRSLPRRMIFFAPWARIALFILGVRVRVHGSAPAPPFLLVSNHLGWLDVAVLASRAPGVFVAMAEIESWPVVSSLCRVTGVLFIDRDRLRDVDRVLAEVTGCLDDGLGVLLFPEAGVSDGSRVRAFRSPLLEVAARTGRPVHHATLSYATPPGSPPAGRTIAWSDDASMGAAAWRVLRLSRIDATLVFGDEPVDGTDRKALARSLHEAVAARFAPLSR